MIRNYNFDAHGIDNNVHKDISHNKIINASADNIPFASKSFDGVLMECSFSVTENQMDVLKECYRVLKTNGNLMISDMYALGEAAVLTGSLGRIDKKENIISIIEKNNFKVELFEDFSHLLKTMWGQMIFDKGVELFYSELGVCSETMKCIKCGYYLIIARKQDKI